MFAAAWEYKVCSAEDIVALGIGLGRMRVPIYLGLGRGLPAQKLLEQVEVYLDVVVGISVYNDLFVR